MLMKFRVLRAGENRHADSLQDIQVFSAAFILIQLSIISHCPTAVCLEFWSLFAELVCKIKVCSGKSEEIVKDVPKRKARDPM